MHRRMLADVERVEMKAKSAHFSQERVHEQFRQTLAAVFHQAGAQQPKVAVEFIRRRISIRTARIIAGVAQSDAHEIQEMAAELRLGNPLSAGRFIAELRFVCRQRRLQFRGARDLMLRRAQFINQPLHFKQIMVKNRRARKLQRVCRGLRRDQRIAVAISADPRAEMQQFGKLLVTQRVAVDFQKGFLNLGVQPRQRFEERHGVKIQAHAHFVNHARFFQAHFVRLPQRSDFRENQRFVFGRVARGQRQPVQIFQVLRDAPPFQEHGAPRHFGGMRGEDRRNFSLRRAASASSAEIPAARMRNSVPRNEPASGGCSACNLPARRRRLR